MPGSNFSGRAVGRTLHESPLLCRCGRPGRGPTILNSCYHIFASLKAPRYGHGRKTAAWRSENHRRRQRPYRVSIEIYGNFGPLLSIYLGFLRNVMKKSPRFDARSLAPRQTRSDRHRLPVHPRPPARPLLGALDRISSMLPEIMRQKMEEKVCEDGPRNYIQEHPVRSRPVQCVCIGPRVGDARPPR